MEIKIIKAENGWIIKDVGNYKETLIAIEDATAVKMIARLMGIKDYRITIKD